MVTKSELMTLARIIALVALATSSVASIAPSLADTVSDQIPAILDVTDYVFRGSETPAHLPLPSNGANIGPGSYLLIDRPDGLFLCTANFIWTDSGGTKKYLGSAGHCFLPEDKSATHGPGADFNASSITVDVCYSSCLFGGQAGVFNGEFARLGPVSYARQTSAGIDVGNDFGIVEIPPSLNALIRTSMPMFGGPTTTEAIELGEAVCHYGNGEGVGEVFLTKGRVGVGVITNETRGSWHAETATIPGDSGSAVNVCIQDSGGIHGRGAAGIITHLTPGLATTAGTTVVRAISLATQAGLSISVVLGS